jgi:ATP-dependent RNA helicase RhlE
LTFEDFNFEPELLDSIQSMGYEKPTPVQELTIPIILEGKDLIGCAQTGTGKTAAFLLPVLNRIQKNAEWGKHINTLIIVPTRELAIQIDQQMQGLSYFMPVSSIPVYGGNDSMLWEKQKEALTQGAEMVIATPGRLMSHIALGYVNFDNLQHLILDEADRMLDMGFNEDIMKIVNYLPKNRQTLMFSATMPEKIRHMAKSILRNPEQVNIAVSRPAEKILQAAYRVEDNKKIALLTQLIHDKEYVKSILIFSSTKHNTKAVEKELKRLGFAVRAIHSDLEQNEREEALRDFKNHRLRILVATDILSRGIDIEDIDIVINYDVPHEPEDYIHRIGRTARAENDGVALTFVNKKEERLFKRIENFLKQPIYMVPLPQEL